LELAGKLAGGVKSATNLALIDDAAAPDTWTG